MLVNYRCPRCERVTQQTLDWSQAEASWNCGNCNVRFEFPAGAIQEGHLTRCLVCPSTDLYTRKAFPPRLGAAIVIAGFVGSCVAWYFYLFWVAFGILFATAALDIALFLIVGESLVCYRCRTEYRDAPQVQAHGTFVLETHERQRQAAARLAATSQVGAPAEEK